MYSETIIDQHDQAGQAKAVRKAETEAQGRRDHEKAMAAARQAFDFAFREWRAGRPEYKAMAATIKREAVENEIELAAVAAGCTANDWIPMIEQRRRALRVEQIAKEHPTRQKALDSMEKKWLDAERRFNGAQTPGERDAAEVELLNLEEPRRAAQQAQVESRLATQAVEAARAVGLI